MANLRLVFEDFFHQIFEDDFIFEGSITPVRFTKNKFTGEVKICANDTARVLGFDNLNDLLGTDRGLDVINEWKRDHPDKPLFGKDGSGAMFEEARFYQ